MNTLDSMTSDLLKEIELERRRIVIEKKYDTLLESTELDATVKAIQFLPTLFKARPKRAKEAIKNALDCTDHFMNKAAAELILDFDKDIAIELYERLRGDKDPTLTGAMLEALCVSDHIPEEIDSTYLRLLSRLDEKHTIQIIRRLSGLPFPHSEKTLTIYDKILRSAQTKVIGEVQESKVTIIQRSIEQSHTNTEGPLTMYQDLIKDYDSRIRKEVIEAIGKLGRAACSAIFDDEEWDFMHKDEPESVSEVTKNIHPNEIEYGDFFGSIWESAGIKDKELNVRADAARRIEPLLTEINDMGLIDKHPSVREEAIYNLRYINSQINEADIETFENLATDESEDVRFSVAKRVQNVKPREKALEICAKLLNDTSKRVKQRAFRSVSQMAEDQPDIALAMYNTYALKEFRRGIDPETAIPQGIDALTELHARAAISIDSTLRREVASRLYLNRYGSDLLVYRLLLSDNDDEVLVEVAQKLKRLLKPPVVVELYYQALDHAHEVVRSIAAQHLGDIPDTHKEDREKLYRKAMEDPVETIRNNAEYAIENIGVPFWEQGNKVKGKKTEDDKAKKDIPIPPIALPQFPLSTLPEETGKTPSKDGEGSSDNNKYGPYLSELPRLDTFPPLSPGTDKDKRQRRTATERQIIDSLTADGFKPSTDPEYVFAERYIDSKYVKTEKGDRKSQDIIFQELTEAFKDESNDFEKMLPVLEAGEARDLAEMIECSKVEVSGYTILRKLGEGADGIVYQAAHKTFGDVKVKIFKDPEDKIKKAMEEEGVTLEKRIERRIRLFDKKVRNKTHLTQLYETGRCINPRTGEETSYITSDYVDAGAIGIKDGEEYKIRTDLTHPETIYDVFMKILDGLEAIHDAGLVLKDIKLRNILVSADHKTVLIDDLETIAGIDDASAGSRLTEGSDRYAAPEVLRDIKNASPQSDVYAAAVCMVYMLSRDPTGFVGINSIKDKPEYVDKYVQTFQNVFNNKGYSDVVHRCITALSIALSYDPEDRFVDAGDFKRYILKKHDVVE